MRPRMKGQMIFEFIVATVMFFGIILFTINYLNTEVNTYSGDYFINEMESKSVQVSELLMHTPGSWKDDGSADYIGLSDNWPILNMTKVNNMQNYYCSSDQRYNEMLEKMDMKIKLLYGGEWINRWLRTYITITKISDYTPVLECGYEPAAGTIAKTERIGILNGDLVRMSVSVWF